jgi:DNA repair protein RecN (Recombination protein N)
MTVSRQAGEASIQLKDLAGRLRAYAEQLEADPDRQAAVEDRLDLLQRLKKKYGGSIAAVLATGARAREELQAMETQEERIATLTAKIEAAACRVFDSAKDLSKKRRDAAKRLTTLVAAELAALKMDQMSFEVVVSSDDGPGSLGPTGRDRVEFLLSGNKGEPSSAGCPHRIGGGAVAPHAGIENRAGRDGSCAGTRLR